MKFVLTTVAVLGLGAPAQGALSSSQIDANGSSPTVDGIINVGEYGASYANGGGTSFGGTVGNGTVYMDADATNLYIGFQPGNTVNDLVTILLDTKTGGFTDAQMSDNGDGARRAVSQQSINADDLYDANFLPDYGLVLANFGSVLFETKASPDALNFLDFNGTTTFPREYVIPLATLGASAGSAVNFLVAYVADSGYGSNESLPAFSPLNSTAEPGFNTTSAGYGNYNQFIVPEPASIGLLALSATGLLRRRRRP